MKGKLSDVGFCLETLNVPLEGQTEKPSGVIYAFRKKSFPYGSFGWFRSLVSFGGSTLWKRTPSGVGFYLVLLRVPPEGQPEILPLLEN